MLSSNIYRQVVIVIVTILVCAIAIGILPVHAEPGEVAVTAGPASASASAFSSVASAPVASYHVGETIEWFATIYSPVDLEMWDVSCVPEAVWPARDEGITLIATYGYGGTLAAGETAEQDFDYSAHEIGEYYIACYFWVNDAFYARLEWLIEITA